jgi:cysteinyl-tRNA synthetase
MQPILSFKLFNSLSKQKEVIEPIRQGVVSIYSCGPTVYNYNHIGNFRYYVFTDILRRSLSLSGYTVVHTMNLTDIEDKIITHSIQQNLSVEAFTQKWIDAFFEDLNSLRIQKVEYYPKATESVPEMIDLIDALDKQKLIYEKEGNVYFSISKFQQYGKLSKIDTSGMITGARYDADEYDKNDLRDFVLWKAPKLEKEKFWSTKYGNGRPGWHLECSAMIRKIYGSSGVDIHTGGVDLLFPHHENEIAQSEGAFPKENFVRAWVHCEHLLVENQKMSKSLGNYYTLRDLLGKGYSPKAIRYLLLSFHYRTRLNFSLSRIEESQKAIERLQNTADRVWELLETGVQFTLPYLSPAKEYYSLFLEAITDDLNMPKVLADLFDFVREVNASLDKNVFSKEELSDVASYFYFVNQLLDILDFGNKQDELLDDDIEKLIIERSLARKEKNFKRSDEIRDQLLAIGVILEDTKTGVKWKRK